MEVFSNYFARLLRESAQHLFSNNAANPTFQILLEEVHKITSQDDQSQKIAETIDGGDADIFRDFDLSTFMQRTGLDGLEKTILALAFKTASRSDLRNKGMYIPNCSLVRRAF